MHVTIYGTRICPDCEEAIAVMSEKKADYTFLEFSDTTTNLKEFIKLRDQNVLFDTVKAEGKIGIPCFIFEDGFLTLDLEKAVAYLK